MCIRGKLSTVYNFQLSSVNISTSNCQLSTFVNFQLSTVYICQLSTVYICQLSTVYICQLSTVYWQAPLNSQLTGGSVVLEGEGSLSQGTLCVEWESNENFAITCDLEEEEGEDRRKTYRLVRCEDLLDTRCSAPIVIS